MLNKIKQIAALIKKYDHAYYENNISLISDLEYDQLKQKYYNLISEAGVEDSFVNQVGASVSKSKVRHKYKMLSLQNCYDLNGLIKFYNSVISYTKEYLVELKIDGLAFAAQYSEGVLQSVSTRGDGEIGEDITQNMVMIGMPYIINQGFTGEVYGEVYMDKDTYIKYNDIFSNPRNAASGTIRLLNPLSVKERKLKYFAYNIRSNTMILNSQEEVLKSLIGLGFNINKEYRLLNSIEDINIFYEEIIQKRDSLPYEIDGLVCKVNDKSYYEKIGETYRFPKYSIAYKFPAKVAYTKLLRVESQVGRTGIITPVAILNPIHLQGVVITKCSLHNFNEISLKDIYINDYVYIQRSGDVIPKILGVVRSKRGPDIEKIIPPISCPSCNYKTVKEKIYLRCINEKCSSVLENKMTLFISKQGFNINGFAKKTISSFINHGIIKNILDIFNLNFYKDRILLLDGWRQKSLDNLLDSIEKSRNVNMQNLIFALGIPHIGMVNAIEISKNIKSIQDFLDLNNDILQAVYGLGEQSIGSILKYIKENQEFIIELAKHTKINFTTSQKIINKNIKNNIFYNKNICITGVINNMSRAEVFNLISKFGGVEHNAIKNDTDILVYSNVNSNKYKKALATDRVLLLSQEEFLNILNKM